MSRCSTPDRLIGIGGGGSRVVYRFMQQDWLLEDVMKTEEYDDPVPDTLRATVIDSATEDDFHNSEAATVERKVEAAYEGTDFLPEDGFLEFDGPHLISEMIPDRWRSQSLTAPPSVRDLCHDQGLNSWWLKEGREPLSKVNDAGFAGGVLRRRSVSKLLFHIAEYTDNSVVPGGPDEEQIYIVAALGGGTGSGMALDLASELQGGDSRVHLFGVLPHENAGGLEKTNAHAALSELEYAHLTGEGPFETITLVPHLETLENDDRDFEMGVIRSILAHQNGIGSDNLTTYITPTSDITTNPPQYTPFTLAAPYTVKYDIGVQPEAKLAVEEFLDNKKTELEREGQLYDVIEQYLDDSFPDSAGQELAGRGGGTLDTEQGRETAYQIRQRIEDDIRETLLEQQAFELADLGDLVADLKESIDSIPNIEPPSEGDEDKQTPVEGGDPMTEAVNFVESVPEKVRSRIESSGEFEYKPDDDLYYDLVDVIVTEMGNVATRRDIWKATSTITAEDTNLEQDEAELVRTAIRDVIMDPDRVYLTDEFGNPSIEDMIGDWRGQRNALEGTVGELAEFYGTVADDLKSRSNEWNDAVYEEAKTLAAINDHQETVEEAIRDLIREIENAVERIENASTEDAVDDVSLDAVGPLADMTIEGVRPLNDKLEEMGAETVPMSEIQSGFSFVKDAKRNKLNHGGGIPVIGNGDRSEEFSTNLTSARENGWFEINPTSPDPNVEETFSCRFKSDKLRRESEIETTRDQLIKGVVDDFETAFSEDGHFVTYTFEYSTNMGGSDTKTISLPQGLDGESLKTTVQKALRNTGATEPAAVLDDTLPMSGIDTSDPKADLGDIDSSTTRTLADAYLRPIASEYVDVEDRVRKLTGGEANQPVGLVDRFQLLRGLSTGSVDRDDLDLYQANPYKQNEETYGQSFAWSYDGLYAVDLDYEGIDRGDTRNHPYLRQEEADVEDMAGSPDDIGDTDILEKNEPRIVRYLANSVTDLFNNEHGRAPISTLNPVSKGEQVKPNYDQIRICPVYMSRALDDEHNLNEKYEAVKDRFADGIELVNEDMYNPESHNTGDRDEITMVTFVGGLFLDNIDLVTKRGGYKDTYERSAASNFIGAHHTIGLGGMWNRWGTMNEWVTEDGRPFPGDYGAYVYRDTTRKVDEEFMSEIMIADEDGETDTRDLFLDMLTADAYESTVDVNETIVDADD